MNIFCKPFNLKEILPLIIFDSYFIIYMDSAFCIWTLILFIEKYYLYMRIASYAKPLATDDNLSLSDNNAFGKIFNIVLFR